MGTFLGVPIIRIIDFGVYIGGPRILGNYHIGDVGIGQSSKTPLPPLSRIATSTRAYP